MKSFFLFMALIALAPQESEPVASRCPPCGAMAAFGLLECTGNPTELEDVLTSLGDHTDVGELSRSFSVKEIRHAMSVLGLETDAIRVKSCDISELPAPCILHYPPGTGVGEIRWAAGHFITVVKFINDEAVILDWNDWTADPARHVSTAALSTEWEGVAIVPVRSMRKWLWSVTALAALAFAFYIKHWRFSRRRTGKKRMALTVLFLLASTFLGCRKEPTSLNNLAPTLVIESPVAELGIVSPAKPIELSFKFTVWDQGDVVLKEVNTSCGCTTSNTPLIGQSLRSGESYNLPIRIRPETDSVSKTQTIRLVTAPATDVPLAMAVQYTVDSGPECRAGEIVIRVKPDFTPPIKVQFVDRRPLADNPVRWVRETFQSTFLQVDDVVRSSEVVKPNRYAPTQIAADVWDFTLKLKKALPIGEHTGFTSFRFSDGTQREVKTKIIVSGQLDVASRQLFCGYLKPGSPWKLLLRCKRTTVGAGFPVDVSVNDESMDAHFSEDLVTVTGTAPLQPGRFIAELRIVPRHDDALPVIVPISGIVKGAR